YSAASILPGWQAPACAIFQCGQAGRPAADGPTAAGPSLHRRPDAAHLARGRPVGDDAGAQDAGAIPTCHAPRPLRASRYDPPAHAAGGGAGADTLLRAPAPTTEALARRASEATCVPRWRVGLVV